jgi:hypothetical protein
MEGRRRRSKASYAEDDPGGEYFDKTDVHT